MSYIDKIDVVGSWTSAVALGVSLANVYKSEQWTAEEKINALIRNICTRNGALGALTSTAGMIPVVGLPADIGLSTYNSVTLQISLAAGVAHLRGHDTSDRRTWALMAIVVVGKKMGAEAVKQALRSSIKGITKSAITANARLLVRALVPILGKSIIQRSGLKTAASLTKMVPVVGSIVGGVIDGGMCYAIAKLSDFALFDGSFSTLEH